MWKCFDKVRGMVLMVQWGHSSTVYRNYSMHFLFRQVTPTHVVIGLVSSAAELIPERL